MCFFFSCTSPHKPTSYFNPLNHKWEPQTIFKIQSLFLDLNNIFFFKKKQKNILNCVFWGVLSLVQWAVMCDTLQNILSPNNLPRHLQHDVLTRFEHLTHRNRLGIFFMLWPLFFSLLHQFWKLFAYIYWPLCHWDMFVLYVCETILASHEY